MSTSNSFAYNTGSPIDGTTQVGDLSVGVPTTGYTSSPQFWNGPDQDLGYVIAVPVSGNTQPTPVSGVDASLGFYRSQTSTDADFIQLSEFIARKNGTPQTFTGATEASNWLTSNGFWNSYGSGYSFVLNPSDISNGYVNYNSWNSHDYPATAFGTNGTEGYNLTYYGGEPSYLLQAANVPYYGNIATSTIPDLMNTLYTDGLFSNPSETALWEVSWGPGSTYTTTYASFGHAGSVGSQFYLAALDTTDPNWNQPGNNSTALAGNFYFPATFTLVLPVVNKGGWC